MSKKMPSCKVKNCKELHWKHYCVFCKDSNSRHFSNNCTVKSELYKKDFWDACGVIVYHPKTNMFLLQHRSLKMRNGPNKFGIISGRKEMTEIDPLVTALRETKEEFYGNHIDMKTFKKSILTQQKINSTYIFIIACNKELNWKGEPDCKWELCQNIFDNGHTWVSYDQLKSMVFNNGSIENIKMWEYRKYTFRCMWTKIQSLNKSCIHCCT